MSSSVEVDYISDNRVSMVVGTVQGQMLHGFRSAYFWIFDEVDKLPAGGEVSAGEVDDPGRDCSREEQILCFLRGSVLADELEDPLNVLLEALLQHLVCLIKASYLQVR